MGSDDGSEATATSEEENPGVVANCEYTEGLHYINFSGPMIKRAQGFIGLAHGDPEKYDFGRMSTNCSAQIALHVENGRLARYCKIPGPTEIPIKLQTLAGGEQLVMCIEFESGLASVSFALDGV